MFNWGAGFLKDLTVRVERSETTAALMKVIGGAGARSMRSTILHVEGGLTWSEGDVAVTAPDANTTQLASQINIVRGGLFNIYYTAPQTATSGGRIWGSDAVAFKVINHGTLTFQMLNTSDYAVIKGDYSTTGETTLIKGTLKVNGAAEQTGSTSKFVFDTAFAIPTFALDGPNGVLKIRDGTITGTGVVAGHLSLGYDPGEAGYNAVTATAVHPILAPSMRIGSFGQITVTNDLNIFKGELRVGIQSPSESDRVWANGVLMKDDVLGTVVTNEAIPIGTKILFLKYAARSTTSTRSGLPLPSSGAMKRATRPACTGSSSGMSPRDSMWGMTKQSTKMPGSRS